MDVFTKVCEMKECQGDSQDGRRNYVGRSIYKLMKSSESAHSIAIDRYDIEADEWKRMHDIAGSATYNGSFANMDDNVYLIGGFHSGGVTKDVSFIPAKGLMRIIGNYAMQ